MPRVTVSVSDDLLSRIEERVNQDDEDRNKPYESRSEAIRELVEDGLNKDDELAELRDEYEMQVSELQTTVERLRNEKRQLIRDREEKQELVEYVEQERELQEQTQELKSQPVWSRAKTWVLGR